MKRFLPLLLAALLLGGYVFAQYAGRGPRLFTPSTGSSSGVTTATSPLVVTGSDVACTAAGAGVSGCLTNSGGKLVVDAGFVSLGTITSGSTLTSGAGIVATAAGTTIGNSSCGIAFVPNSTTVNGAAAITLHGPVTADNAANKGTITLSSGTGTATGITAGSICVCTDTASTPVIVRCNLSSTTLTASEVSGTSVHAISYLCF